MAGTFGHETYLPAQGNLDKYSPHRQHGSIIDQPYYVLGQMQWTPPSSDALVIDPAKPTMLYHSFWLNAAWRADQDANRVVVLEPSWFARFPVAPHVTDYLLRCAREIPGAQVVVAEFERPGPGRRGVLHAAPLGCPRGRTGPSPDIGSNAKDTEVKDCVVCGRPFANRKKWRQRGQWEQIVYCSERCRRNAK